MKKILMIQTTLNKTGNTNKIAKFAYEELKKEKDYQVEYLDLKETTIELCDGSKLEQYSKKTQERHAYIQSFDAYMLASPVYNYAVSGVCKNFLDIHAQAMENKYLGLLESAGSMREQKRPSTALRQNLSYFKTSLLEICPRTTYKSFKGDELIDETFKSEFNKLKIELKNVIVEHKSHGID